MFRTDLSKEELAYRSICAEAHLVRLQRNPVRNANLIRKNRRYLSTNTLGGSYRPTEKDGTRLASTNN
jgi:hypothetical protein